jgi:prophage DNA circulation protein
MRFLEADAMVYEVCVLVATIILGMLGIELILWIHTARKLTAEVNKMIQQVNVSMPSMLEDVKVITGLVKHTTEQVTGTVNEVAGGFERLRKNPLQLMTDFLEIAKKFMVLWQEFWGRKKRAS